MGRPYRQCELRKKIKRYLEQEEAIADIILRTRVSHILNAKIEEYSIKNNITRAELFRRAVCRYIGLAESYSATLKKYPYARRKSGKKKT